MQRRMNPLPAFSTASVPVSRGGIWAQKPHGCQPGLLPPPFLLDDQFRTDPKWTAFPEITSVLTAITMAGAGDIFDLERLETMGDSFLKLMTCLYLYVRYPGCHEGQLDHLKAKQISNYNLYRLGKQLGLPPFVINQVWAFTFNWSIDLLIDRFVDFLIDWSIDWWINRLGSFRVDQLFDWFTVLFSNYILNFHLLVFICYLFTI